MITRFFFLLALTAATVGCYPDEFEGQNIVPKAPVVPEINAACDQQLGPNQLYNHSWGVAVPVFATLSTGKSVITATSGLFDGSSMEIRLNFGIYDIDDYPTNWTQYTIRQAAHVYFDAEVATYDYNYQMFFSEFYYGINNQPISVRRDVQRSVIQVKFCDVVTKHLNYPSPTFSGFLEVAY